MKFNCKNLLKILIVVFIAITMIFITTNVYGAINEDYKGNGSLGSNSPGSMSILMKNTLLTPITQLIYFCGWLMEKTLSFIFQMMTGTNDFPWADKIVFNAVPLLDINFINPSGESILKTSGDVYKVISKLYATIFTMSTTFFSIVVMVMAIKLVTTAIASEKAKYKQAIWDWLVGLVMLFTIHILISFVFYLNETLVVMASQIVTNSLAEASKKATVAVSENSSEFSKRVRATAGREWVADLIDAHPQIINAWLTLPEGTSQSRGIHQGLMKNQNFFYKSTPDAAEIYDRMGYLLYRLEAYTETDLKNLKEFQKTILGVGIKELALQSSYEQVFKVRPSDQIGSGTDDRYFEAMKPGGDTVKKSTLDDGSPAAYTTRPAGWDWGTTVVLIGTGTASGAAIGVWGLGIGALPGAAVGATAAAIMSAADWVMDNTINKTAGDLVPLTQDLITLASASISEQKTATAGDNVLLSNLAMYFKYNSFTYELNDTGDVASTKKGEGIIQNALMYAILVTQSLILFIAYLKRLFYVMILSMMAPLVVVADFFSKSVSGK